MPRIQPVPPDPDANAVVNNPLWRTMKRRPEIADAFARLDSAARFHGQLPLELKETVRRATACTVGCAYCESLGVVGDELDERTMAAVRFARLVAADPAAVTDEQFDELRALFDEDEIIELVAFICLVAIAGQMFGAVIGLEATSPAEAAEYQAVLARRS
jgi:alkylhydroperoxidase family enzyme